MTPPTGPVFLSLPGDILNDKMALDMGQSTRVDSVNRPNDSNLEMLAKRILAAAHPVILAGHESVRPVHYRKLLKLQSFWGFQCICRPFHTRLSIFLSRLLSWEP